MNRSREQAYAARRQQAAQRARKPIGVAIKAGAEAGFLLFGLQLMLHTLGLGSLPLGVAGAANVLHWHGIAALGMGMALQSLSGVVWGALYGATIPKFSVWTGLAFGFVPWLCATLFVLPLLGHLALSEFNLGGVLLSLLQLLLWGAYVGTRCEAVAGSR